MSRIISCLLKNKVAFLPIVALSALASLMIAGCGSSGGGGGGGTSGLSYSGLTSQAVITDTNASAIAANAYSSGNRGMVFGGMGAALNGPQPQPAGPRRLLLIDVMRIFQHSLEEIDYASVAAQNSASALQQIQDEILGDCGGQGAFNIQVDDVTGAFSGSLTFSRFCSEGTTIGGKATFSGTVNLDTEELEAFSIRFDRITGTCGSESFTLDGDVDVTVQSASIGMTMDMLIQDNTLDKVYRIDNYRLTVSEAGSYASIRVSGRFYDPDYGYVTLSTESPLLINAYDDYPYAGTLVFTGNSGSAGGPTRARLSALSADTCQVQADTNGDGNYDGADDYDSGVILWEDLGA